MYGKSQKERMDNLDQANQEIDRLRKQLDKLQVELQGKCNQGEKNCSVLNKIVIFVNFQGCRCCGYCVCFVSSYWKIQRSMLQ